ncbi:MarR family transcriptional regulator, partial [Rhizobium leguminosarum]
MSETPPPPSSAFPSAWTSIPRARERPLAATEADLKEAAMPPLAWYDVLQELAHLQEGMLLPY